MASLLPSLEGWDGWNRRRNVSLMPEPAAANGDCSRPLSLSGQSYWLDVWLFVLFDLALLVFVYLLP
uniref:Uncharacterized protein n=1 Tax=Terrapene triunguis TaxID=2587831 RepID=A0A674IBL3_9SAUR